MFGRKNPAEEEKQYVPGTKIPYKPNLISTLTADHVVLLELYSQVGECLEQHDGKGLSETLSKFARKLRAHLLEENVCLYVYMKHVLKSEPDSLEIVISFQREMGEIGKVVNRFVTKYTSEVVNWTPQRFLEFSEEYRQVGAALQKYIEHEEEPLYSLYMPPSAFMT